MMNPRIKLAVQNLLVALFFITTYSMSAQPYGNEWIVMGQDYYKIRTVETGIHRLTFADLTAAGVPLVTIDPRNMQIWHRGVQQNIVVAGESDGSFNSGDYIEFYGIKNDGWQDEEMYLTGLQPHQYTNLFSDTSAYFLTWGAAGKRMSTINATKTLVPEPYHLEEEVLALTTDYHRGRYYFGSDINRSEYDDGEGWFGPARSKGQNITYTLGPIPDIDATGPKPQLEVMLVGANAQQHVVDLKVGDAQRLWQSITSGFVSRTFYKVTADIEFSDINASGELDVRMDVVGFASTDRVAIAYIKLVVPQDPDMNGASAKTFYLEQNVGDTSYLEVANYPAGAIVYDLTDRNNIEILSSSAAANLEFYVPGTAGQNKTIYVNENGSYITPLSIEPIIPLNPNFRDHLAANANYIIISHPDLWTAATAYDAYRSAEYNTLLADIEHLYDQYSYGEKSPMAIRRFMAYLVDNSNPQYLFIIGWGTINESRADKISRQPPPDLIPTYGVPGSDQMFVMGLGTAGKFEPAVAVGRLPAYDEGQVYDYLDKVQAHEALPYDELWRKNMVHLSGGADASQQASFLNHMNNLRNIAEAPLMGADVTTYSKSTLSPTEFINISEEVNKGASMVTFLGHSSATVTDIDIGYVSEPIWGYNNQDKYPLLMINGCSFGNMFDGTVFAPDNIQIPLSVDWIVAQNKGSILNIGNSDVALSGELISYSSRFYNVAFPDTSFFSMPMGDIHKEAQRLHWAGALTNNIRIAQVQQMLLQGDPGIILFGPEKPDYYTYDDQLSMYSFDGNPITAVSDSFAIQIAISNFGRATTDSFAVFVRRTINGTEVIDYEPIIVPPIYNKDTVLFTIESKDVDTYGQSRFEIFVDYFDSIPELNEMNNIGVIEYFIPLSAITPLYPKEYAIVGTQPITFVAQATDLFTENTDYFIEWDTSYSFNSPAPAHGQTVVNAGSVVSWTTSLLDTNDMANDSMVYYWRVRFNNIGPGEDTIWGESSFMYIPNKWGWSQAAHPQFQKDKKTNAYSDINQRIWGFDTVVTNISASSGDMNQDQYDFNMLVDGTFFMRRSQGDRCGNNGLVALVFDRVTAKFKQPVILPDEDDYCGPRPRKSYTFKNIHQAVQQQALRDLIGAMNDGDYLLLVSEGDAQYSTWSTALRDSILLFGADSLGVLQDGDAYILLAEKGQPDPIAEIRGELNVNTLISLNTDIKGKFYDATIRSTLIGPAIAFDEFYRLYDYSETGPVTDNIEFDIIGVTLDGTEDTLYTFANTNEYDSLDLVPIIDPNVYPYMRLQARATDFTNLTIPQLERWQVIYQGVPEGTMNPALVGGAAAYQIPVVAEGDSFNLSFAFQNISDLSFSDSLIVRYTITSNTTGAKKVFYDTLSSLAARDTLYFSQYFNTAGFGGDDNRIEVYVNPKIQPEEYYNNNILVFDFGVDVDKIHPVIDVVFDGKHIVDGDIVSSSPMITMTVRDENQFLKITDTTGVEIFLKSPDSQGQGDPIFFTDPDVISWGQLPGSANVFQVVYNPQNLPDGRYELIIQGYDASGNKSGTQQYRISFEVINASYITHVLPYPNPFSTSTRFVFTLTGNEVPDEMKIQIMTVTGRVVREITQDEIGPITIGNNVTEFAWDGTDEFGDRLANGVYLYRVMAKINGEDIDNAKEFQDGSGKDVIKGSSHIDKGFKKGYGKLYILR